MSYHVIYYQYFKINKQKVNNTVKIDSVSLNLDCYLELIIIQFILLKYFKKFLYY